MTPFAGALVLGSFLSLSSAFAVAEALVEARQRPIWLIVYATMFVCGLVFLMNANRFPDAIVG